MRETSKEGGHAGLSRCEVFEKVGIEANYGELMETDESGDKL